MGPQTPRRKGEENGNADCLSTVQQNGNLSETQLQQDQDRCIYVLDHDPALNNMPKRKCKSWTKCTLSQLQQPQSAPDIQQLHQPAYTMQHGGGNQKDSTNMVIRLFQSKPKKPNPAEQNFKQLILQAHFKDEWCNQIRAVLSGNELGQPPHIVRWVQTNVIIELDGISLKSAHLSTAAETRMRKVLQILLPAAMRNDIMLMIHTHPVHGHRGITSTYRIIRDSFYWPTMHSDMKEHIARCETCQRKKPSPASYTSFTTKMLSKRIYGLCRTIWENRWRQLS